MAAGVPDHVFWDSTPAELARLMEALRDRAAEDERRATLRAGLVASAVYNVHRRKGAHAIRPEDFVRTPVQVVDGATFRSMFRDLIGEGEAAEA